jgi:cytosine/adenosine deaminase-related metal-dependent hydrolase
VRPDLDPAALQTGELLLLPEHVMLRDGPVRDTGVLVANGEFREVDAAAALVARHPRLKPVRLDRVLLMPGFVDTHHHLSQSFGKALAFGEPSEIFRRIWVPLEGVLDDALVYLAAKLAALEALRGGFTTVCDAGTRSPDGIAAIARAARDAGIRCVLALTCNDAGKSEAERAAVRAAADRHLADYADGGTVHPSLAISIPEAASDAMLAAIARKCADAKAAFQVHVNEHLASVERSIVERGLRPLEHMDRAGALGPQALVAHATLVTPYELNLLRETDTAVSYNPVASAWKGNAVANAQLWAALGIRFGIGTDGTRSDGFRLADAAETAQRLAFGLQTGDSSCGGGWLWLDHATTGGAHAAGLGATTGEIAPGKRADFLLVDLDVPEMTPSWDLTWELVRLAGRDQIVGVFVDGRLRLWHGWPLDWDGRALLREVDEAARGAVSRAPIKRVHPTSDAHRAQVRARGWQRRDSTDSP